MMKLIPRFKTGYKTPDWDPTNPYHYHTPSGEKVVVTPEDWEKYKDDPTFREVRAAVEAEHVAGNILDRIGNPTVVTTGLQENTIKSTEADRYLQSKNPMLSYQKNEDTGEYEIMMKPVTITAKKTNPVKPKVELRPASELNADEFWDMMEANSKQNGVHLYQEGGPFKIGYAAPPISNELEGAPVTSPAFSTKKLIYGSNEATRARVREKYPVINQVVDSVAKAYDLNPSVLNNRVNSEGLIDRIAQLNDEAVEGARDFRHNWQTNDPRKYDFPTNGFRWYGLDDVATLIEQGKVQPINEVWEDEWNENEKGRMVHSASGKTWVDNIGLMGATLKYFRSLVEKDFPGKDDKFYDEGALAYWNRGRTGGKKYMQGPRTDSRYKTFSTGGSLGKITPLGQWQYPHQVTTIPSNNITMKGAEYPLHKFQRGGYITNGRTLADGRTVYPISDLPAEDTPTSLPAAKINLKPVTVTAKHPLWDLPDYQGKEDNPNINAHKDELYQNRRRREEAGKNYMKWAAPLAMSPLVLITGPLLGEAWNAASNVALQGSKNALTTAGKMMLPSTWTTAAGLSSGIGTAADAAMFSGMAVNAGRNLLDKDNWTESGKYNNDNWGGWQGGANLLLDLAMTAPITRAVKGGVGLVGDAANAVQKLKPVYLTPKQGYAYRRIDNKGFQDLVESGMIRPNQQGVFARDGHIQSGTWFNLDTPARGGGKIRYPGDYIIEITPEHPQFPTKTTPGTESLGYRLGDMQIDASSPYVQVYKKGKLVPKKKYSTLDEAMQEALYEDATIASLNEEFENRPIALTIPKIIRQAKSDLAAMNLYHDLNVAEYNAAMNSNIESIPFRTNIGQAKVMPKEDFIGLIKSMKMNTPDNNPNNVGGFYSYNDDMVYIPNITHPSNVYHEYLHQGRYGVTNPEITRWRINQLVDKKTLESMKPEDRKYFMSEMEFPVHLRQQGEKYGIKVGEPYPGEETFDKLIEEKGIGGAAYYVKRDTPEQKELFWKALNGTLFGSIPIGIGIGVSQSQSN